MAGTLLSGWATGFSPVGGMRQHLPRSTGGTSATGDIAGFPGAPIFHDAVHRAGVHSALLSLEVLSSTLDLKWAIKFVRHVNTYL